MGTAGGRAHSCCLCTLHGCNFLALAGSNSLSVGCEQPSCGVCETMLSSLLRLRILLVFTLCLLASVVFAGSGPQNVLVVVNTNSKDSLELGNAYRRARGIPYRQLLAITVTTNARVPLQTYLDEIETPIRTYLKNQKLTDEINCIVLTRGIPLVTTDTVRSTASLLATMNIPERKGDAQLRNPYFSAPDAFSHRTPALRGMYLVTMLNGYNNSDILNLIAQGVAADGTAPDGRFVLQTIPQSMEQAKALQTLLAIRNLKAEVTTTPPDDRSGLMAYLSGGVLGGLNKELIAACHFRPGALVDMAQNFSAVPDNFDELAAPVPVPVSWFIHAGVTGIHGVVGEAGINTMPLVSAPQQLLGKYTAGFSLAESFYAALPFVNWQNVVIGDPLCAPYAQRPVMTVEMDPGPLKGIVPIRVTANSPTRGATIRRVDAYIDGQFVQTIYEPEQADITMRIGVEDVHYTVPRGATVNTLLEGLTEAINNNPMLNGVDGVKAVPSLATGTLTLVARKPGAEANDIPTFMKVETANPAATSVVARVEGGDGWLSGGGQDPVPARAVISLLGRRIKPGDTISLQIQQEHLVYTVPEAKTPRTADVADALVNLINAHPQLQDANGVVAIRGQQGMPYLTLQARTPGDEGNEISLNVTVNPTEGSLFRAYPDVPTLLSGGRDGSASTQTIHFMVGDVSAKATYLLNTAQLADGYHQLRLVAYDGSLAHVQGSNDVSFISANLAAPPTVTLPDTLTPSSGEVVIPVTADPSVAQVGLYVDGQLLATTNTAPFDIRVPLTGLGRGAHDVWAEGTDLEGRRYVCAPIALQVLTPPEIGRISPDYTGVNGGTTHRITGNGFQPGCIVRLAGVPARSVAYLSPNQLEVVSETGPARQGKVEVTNPDGTVSAPTCNFEYYQPIVAEVQIAPAREVLGPGQKVQYTASGFDQHGFPIQAELTWEATGAGTISPTGLFIAGNTAGSYSIHVSTPDTPQGWDVTGTVGPVKAPDGILAHWLVLGPWPDPDYTALEKAQIPEETVTPSHGEKIEKLAWKSIYGENGFVNFVESLKPNTDAVAYAHLYLYAPADKDYKLVYGSDDGIRIWLNGQLIQSLRVRRAADPNQNTTPVTLKAGWNRLLVKVDQGSGGWGFYMRVRTLDDKPVTDDLFYALDNPNPPDGK